MGKLIIGSGPVGVSGLSGFIGLLSNSGPVCIACPWVSLGFGSGLVVDSTFTVVLFLICAKSFCLASFISSNFFSLSARCFKFSKTVFFSSGAAWGIGERFSGTLSVFILGLKVD